METITQTKTRRITIDPITRLEGHGKIDIFLDDNGEVTKAYYQIPELRGFEIFSKGTPRRRYAANYKSYLRSMPNGASYGWDESAR